MIIVVNYKILWYDIIVDIVSLRNIIKRRKFILSEVG